MQLDLPPLPIGCPSPLWPGADCSTWHKEVAALNSRAMMQFCGRLWRAKLALGMKT